MSEELKPFKESDKRAICPVCESSHNPCIFSISGIHFTCGTFVDRSEPHKGRCITPLCEALSGNLGLKAKLKEIYNVCAFDWESATDKARKGARDATLDIISGCK